MSKLFTLIIYNILFIAPANVLLGIVSLFSKRIKEGRKVRVNWDVTLRKKMARLPNNRVLFHVSSAGELQQAIPVIEALKKKHSDYIIGISFYSISGYSFFKGNDAVSFTTFMPLDTPANSMKFMQIVNPKMYIIVAYDAWLNHVIAAKNIGSKVYLIAGILSANSSRLKFPLKSITTVTFKEFDKIGVISEGDYRSFSTFIDSEKLEIVGEPRYDYILSQRDKAREKLSKTSLPLWKDYKVFTFGSVWEAGWNTVSPKVLELITNGELKAFIAPHQFHKSFITKIESDLKDGNITYVKYTEMKDGESYEDYQAVIVDTIGLLAAIYSISDFAYIGGGFGKGVHNVAEPASLGIPIYFGPHYQHSFEARRAVAEEPKFLISNNTDFNRDIEQLINDKNSYNSRAEVSKKLIESYSGSTVKTLNLILS